MVPDRITVEGHTAAHARLALRHCGRESLRVLRDASRSGRPGLPPDEAFRTLASVLPPAAFAQSGPDGWITFGVPNETPVKVAWHALHEAFFRRLLSIEVMCS